MLCKSPSLLYCIILLGENIAGQGYCVSQNGSELKAVDQYTHISAYSYAPVIYVRCLLST